MSALTIELPAELASELALLGLTSESKVSDWVADAIRQKLSAAKQSDYLEGRAARGDRAAFERIMAKIPAVQPAENDRW
jgi:hypothetical protein